MDLDPDPRPTPEPPLRRRSEPMFNLPGAVTTAIAICVGIHLIRLYVLSPDQDVVLVLHGAFIPLRYAPEYFDLFAVTSTVTYAFLHGGWLHLILNMVWLAAFGSPLANRLGAARFALFWIASSLGAVALHFAVYPFDPVPLVGASGAISGMMGAAARFGFRIDRSGDRGRFSGAPLRIFEALGSRTVLAFLAIWMVVNLATGLGSMATPDTSPIAWEAHVGGFIVGFFGIGLFTRRSRTA